MSYTLNLMKAINSHQLTNQNLKTISLDSIIYTVEQVTGITSNQISSKSRLRDLADARSLFCYAARKFTNHSTTSIGVYINRDHATVIHSCRKIETLIKIDVQIRTQYKSIENALHALSQNTTPTDIIMQRVVNKLITTKVNVTHL